MQSSRSDKIFELALVCLLSGPAVNASAGDRAVDRVPRADSPIKVDGLLDEPAWERAASISLDYETDPGENVAPPVETLCLVTFDEERLYVAFRAADPDPEKIRAQLADRDTVDSDDFVGVVLDTFNDQRRAYEFFVNPLGVQMDYVRDDVNGRIDSSWNAIWSSAGRLTPEGYVVELAIPFSSLSFPRVEGRQRWGVDAVRIYPRSSRHRLANNPKDRDVDCYLCQLSTLEGFEGVSPGRNLEITPTVTAGRTETREGPQGGFTSGGEDVAPGVTASWGITPNLVLNATVNPDFSQVEADSAQLDVNQQFALFFPERRPFFLEDADIFRTRLNAVFTRNVADPSWGLKLTGKQKQNAFGVFVAEDELTNLLFPASQTSAAGSFEFETTDAVLRYRRDVGSSSAVGALLTSRSGGDYSNVVAGVDGLVRFGGDSDSVRFQYLSSRTEYPLAIAEEFGQSVEAFDDEAFSASYVHQDEKWRWWGVFEDVGEGFRADMGFVPQVGFRNIRTGLQRGWWGEKGDWYRQVLAGFGRNQIDDKKGNTLLEEYSGFVNLKGPWQSSVETSFGTRERFFNGVTFDEVFYSAWVDFTPVGRFWFGLWYRGGDDIDFVNTRPGRVFVLEPNLRYDVNRHLRVRLSHRIQRLEVDGGTLFDAGLTQARFVYQLNLRTFVRAIFQYTDIDREPSLFAEPESVEAKTERLFTQLLFSYKVNPRTVAFLGYSDNYRGDQDLSLTQENRALFLKIGYAWVL